MEKATSILIVVGAIQVSLALFGSYICCKYYKRRQRNAKTEDIKGDFVRGTNHIVGKLAVGDTADNLANNHK